MQVSVTFQICIYISIRSPIQNSDEPILFLGSGEDLGDYSDADGGEYRLVNS